jgi:starch phosphorylase
VTPRISEIWNPHPLPPLPEPLQFLGELVYNLWWSWDPPATAVFADLEPDLWERTGHNPIRLLRAVSHRRLESRAGDGEYVARIAEVARRFEAYLAEGPDPRTGVAYFSAEFGVHESLPIYSGGLGVLAGDICKAASDMGLPLVGVGLLYAQGYFDQTVDDKGAQQASYGKLDMAHAPLLPAILDGAPVILEVTIGARPTMVQVLIAYVGRTPLLLLNTDIAPNRPVDREIGYKLYGGGPGARLRQEMALGIGGVRALRALGFDPRVFHLNEGHAAFATLELAREKVSRGADFATAQREVAARTVFTTHTPVKAGHDEFTAQFMLAHFDGYAPQLKLSEDALLDLGRTRDPHGDGRFSMTSLAFSMADHANAVSERHAQVSRAMWRDLWPGRAESDVPIAAVTNGVHAGTWLALELRAVLGTVDLPRAGASEDEIRAALEGLSDEVLWHLHQGLRARALQAVSDIEAARRVRLELWHEAEAPGLAPEALTIVWARRFATYKRAGLLFRDPQRLAALVHNPERPVQLVFAGKAHPADEPGQAMLAEVFRWSQDPLFAGRLVLVEGYDLALARLLVQGADVWLNTPIPPQEASGTSGQKAALNGVPQLSIPDGWWAEGFAGDNGWAINGGADDAAAAASLYGLLENEVVPRFYARTQGVPVEWVRTMRGAMGVALARFTARHMLDEYRTRMYGANLS